MTDKIVGVLTFPFSVKTAGKLIGTRFRNQSNQVSEVIVMSLKVLSQGLQQFRVRRLECPRGWRGLTGILPVEIKRKRWINQSHSHELRPKQIYRGLCKLQVAGQHSCVGFPQVLSRTGPFSSQQENRLHLGWITLHAGDAVPSQIISLPIFRKSKLAVVSIGSP